MRVKMRAFAAVMVTFILLLGPAELASQEPADTYCVLHHFGAPSTNDAALNLQPAGVITVADDGSLWTTVSRGGAYGAGSVIKMTQDGQYTKVADFNKGTTGGGPQGGLVNGKNGYMYGTTYLGGKWGVGTIFRISVQGGDPEVIYDFRNGRPTGVQPKGL